MFNWIQLFQVATSESQFTFYVKFCSAKTHLLEQPAPSYPALGHQFELILALEVGMGLKR
jgi:hypothetical protein